MPARVVACGVGLKQGSLACRLAGWVGMAQGSWRQQPWQQRMSCAWGLAGERPHVGRKKEQQSVYATGPRVWRERKEKLEQLAGRGPAWP